MIRPIVRNKTCPKIGYERTRGRSSNFKNQGLSCPDESTLEGFFPECDKTNSL